MQSPSFVADKEANCLLRENQRLVQNEIKLLEQNSILREKLFHYENVQAKSNQTNQTVSNTNEMVGWLKNSI